MLSAGTGEPANQVGGNGAQAPGNGQLAGWQPIFGNSQGMQMNPIKATVALRPEDGKALLGNQMIWAGVDSILNTLGRGYEAWLQAGVLDKQYSAMETYYEAQEHIADKQAEVLNKQEDTKIAAVGAQKEMNTENNKTQRELARISSQTTVSLAGIQERGRNERARIYASSKAFTIGPADKYNYGNPQRSLLT